MSAPQTYHEALQRIRDALKYGEISFGFPDYVEIGPHNRYDRRGPLGYMLTTDEFYLITQTTQPHLNAANVLQKAFSMNMPEIIELISYWNLLDARRTGGLPKERVDAQEARLAYDEFLESLLDNRVDYHNPELQQGEQE